MGSPPFWCKISARDRKLMQISPAPERLKTLLFGLNFFPLVEPVSCVLY